ncbi:MAG: arylsulfatase [Flavobacteriaceae bacterium]
MRLLRTTLKILISLSAFWIINSCGNSKKEQPINGEIKKPNVIIIMTDDQGYGDLGYHGNPIVKTPHLDKFASESLELTNFHVGTTCTPTRAGIMTGRNANRNNAWHTIAGCSILLADEETMPEVFERNGYDTAMFGKWHLGDNYPFRPQDRGFKTAVYHGGGGVGQTPDYWNNDYFDDTYFRNGEPEKFKGYCTDVWFKEAKDFLSKKREQPFFLYLAPNAAHGPFNVPESYARIYDNAPLTAEQKRFYGMVSNIDDNFGELIALLKQQKQFDNTILIFTTDNGTARGITYLKDEEKHLGYNAGLRGIKGSHYDGGHKVPFFISWPEGGVQGNTRNASLAAHVDLLPTLTQLAKLPYQTKKKLDGADISKLIVGEETSLDRLLVIDTQRNQLPEKGRNSCVMWNQWRLIDGKELYDIENDPGQKEDIAQLHPERVLKMEKFYEDWWKSLEHDIRYAEIPLGSENKEPVRITVHDMHTQENLPWNQNQIRKAASAPDGYYSVKVLEEGSYSFKLYRYPPESGLAINAVASEVQGTDFRDALPAAKALNLVEAELVFDEIVMERQAVKDEGKYVEIEGDLKKGSYKLKSNFLSSNNKVVPAFYTVIEKL